MFYLYHSQAKIYYRSTNVEFFTAHIYQLLPMSHALQVFDYNNNLVSYLQIRHKLLQPCNFVSKAIGETFICVLIINSKRSHVVVPYFPYRFDPIEMRCVRRRLLLLAWINTGGGAANGRGGARGTEGSTYRTATQPR